MPKLGTVLPQRLTTVYAGSPPRDPANAAATCMAPLSCVIRRLLRLLDERGAAHEVVLARGIEGACPDRIGE